MCGDCFEYLLDGLKHTCVDAPLVLIRQISELAGKGNCYQVFNPRLSKIKPAFFVRIC
jgi:hypothetical protein